MMFQNKRKKKEKATEFVKELPKNADGSIQKCFKCHGYGHYQADCPDRRVITLQKIEKIDLELQEVKQDFDRDDSEFEKQ